jgi:DNA-directed RNA polymerase specialized sigma subunit
MRAQKWLEQVRKLDQLINAKIAERNRLIAIATDISAKPMDGMPYSNTGLVSQKMENAVINLIALEKELDEAIDRYVDYKREVVRTLEALPDKEYGVLHRHYIRYMTWEQVAEDMDYSAVQVWRIKKEALRKLNDVIECNVVE